eukprot:UN33212
MHFCDKHRDRVMNNNPDAIMVEVSTILGKMWSETSEKARAPFVSAMEKSKARYEKEMETYRQTSEYTEFQKRKKTHNLIAKYVDKIPDAKKRNIYKSFPTDPNKPKGPLNSYFLFANDNRDDMIERNPNATYHEIGSLLGEAWANASGTVKSKYQKQHEKLKKEYETTLEKYQSTKKYKDYVAVREEFLAEKKQMNQS